MDRRWFVVLGVAALVGGTALVVTARSRGDDES
jgi:hypothetical protein